MLRSSRMAIEPSAASSTRSARLWTGARRRHPREADALARPTVTASDDEAEEAAAPPRSRPRQVRPAVRASGCRFIGHLPQLAVARRGGRAAPRPRNDHRAGRLLLSFARGRRGPGPGWLATSARPAGPRAASARAGSHARAGHGARGGGRRHGCPGAAARAGRRCRRGRGDSPHPPSGRRAGSGSSAGRCRSRITTRRLVMV